DIFMPECLSEPIAQPTRGLDRIFSAVINENLIRHGGDPAGPVPKGARHGCLQMIGVHIQKYKTAAASPLCWASQKGAFDGPGNRGYAALRDAGDGCRGRRSDSSAPGAPMAPPKVR